MELYTSSTSLGILVFRINLFCVSLQAWHVLSNIQISCRHYAKPGKTRQVKGVFAELPPDTGRITSNSLSDANAGSQYKNVHKIFSEFSVDTTKPSSFLSNLSASSNIKAMEGQNEADGNNMARPWMVNHSHSQRLDGSVNYATNQRNICSSFLEDEDDDILEVIFINNITFCSYKASSDTLFLVVWNYF